MTKHFIEIDNEFMTNSYGKVRVIQKLPKGRYIVEFIDNGVQVNVHRANLIAGKVKDPTRKSSLVLDWIDCNIKTTNNAGDEITIFKRNGKKSLVRFEATGTIVEAYTENVKAGKISDPYKKTFLGVGYLGEPRQTPYRNKAKQLWSNMLKRCYNPNDPRGYYGKASVDTRWHCFAWFLEDLPSLKNFTLWLNADTTGVKYNLDKDLLLEGNTVYSKHTTQFITEFENKSAGGINRHK